MRWILSWCVVFSVAASAAAEVRLERKYVPGSSNTTQIERTDRQTLTLAGQDIETVFNRFTIVTRKIGDRKEDGTLPIEAQFDKLQIELKLPGGITLPFDSGDPNRPADNAILEPALAMLRVLNRTKWTTLLDKENQVQAFEFADNPANGLEESFKPQFDPSKRKQAAARELAALPDKPVNPGDTWTGIVDCDLGLGQTLEFETCYEYLGTEQSGGKTLDKIGLKVTGVTYAIDPASNASFRVKESALKIGSSEGTMLFDREQGAIVEKVSKTTVQGTLSVLAESLELPAKLDLNIEEKITLRP